MLGFQPNARPAQHFADGGFVGGVKKLFGIGGDDNPDLAAYRAQRERERAALAANKSPAEKPANPAAPEPRKAIAAYAGGDALKRREREAGLADGGRVRPRGFVVGPGTGTSDSIKARLSDGEYVLPADTVAAVGVDALDALKDATHTPVANRQAQRTTEPLFAGGGLVDDERKSNSFGDAAAAAKDHGVQQVMGQATQMTATPEVRAAIGQQLDAPVRTQAAVNQIPTDISGQRLPVRTQAAAAPTAAPGLDADPQVRSDRDAFGSAWGGIKGASEDVGRAMADVATLVPRGLVGAYDSAVVRPMRAAGLNAAYLSPALVPDGVDPASMTPFTDQKRMRATTSAAAAPVVDGVANVAPISPGQDVATSLGGAAVATRAGDAYMPAQDVGARGFGTPVAPQAQQVAPGVFRQGNSYGDSAQAAAWGASGTKRPTADDMAAADAIANRSAQQVSALAAQQPTAAGFQPVQAPQVLHSGNSWQARNDLRNAEVSASSIANNGGRWDQHGRGVVSPERAKYAALLSADAKVRGLEPELGGLAMRENAATGREVMRERGLNARSANEISARGFDAQARRSLDARRLGLDERRVGLDEKVKGSEVRAIEQMQGLRDGYANAKTDTERASWAKRIRDLSGKDSGSDWAVQVTPATKNPDGSTSEASIYRYNKRTGDVMRVDGSPSERPAADSQQVQSIVNDTSLSKEQRAAKLRQLGFQ